MTGEAGAEVAAAAGAPTPYGASERQSERERERKRERESARVFFQSRSLGPVHSVEFEAFVGSKFRA